MQPGDLVLMPSFKRLILSDTVTARTRGQPLMPGTGAQPLGRYCVSPELWFFLFRSTGKPQVVPSIGLLYVLYKVGDFRIGGSSVPYSQIRQCI